MQSNCRNYNFNPVQGQCYGASNVHCRAREWPCAYPAVLGVGPQAITIKKVGDDWEGQSLPDGTLTAILSSLIGSDADYRPDCAKS